MLINTKKATKGAVILSYGALRKKISFLGENIQTIESTEE